MFTVTLPSMVAGRGLADALVDRLDGDLHGSVVTVDGRRLVSASPSFAAQLVHRLLVDGAAAEVRVDAAPDQFLRYLAAAAAHAGVGDRLTVTTEALTA